jgi:pilus assembly protein CpaF
MPSLNDFAPAGTSPTVDVRQAHYQDLKEKIHRTLLNRLNLDRLNRVGRAQAEPEIRGLIVSLLDAERASMPLSLFERETLITDVFNELFGLGPLEALLADASISDILVNRSDQIFIEREGRLEPTDLVFKDDQHLLRIIERIVSSVGRRIDESSPMVDARLADGSRVNAVIPPLALDGPVLSIRRFRTDKLGAQDLVGRQSLTQPMLDFLKAAVGSRLNISCLAVPAPQDNVPERAVRFISPRAHRHHEDAAELVLRQRTWCASRRARPTSRARAP